MSILDYGRPAQQLSFGNKIPGQQNPRMGGVVKPPLAFDALRLGVGNAQGGGLSFNAPPSNTSSGTGGFGSDLQVNPQQASMQNFGTPDDRPPPETPDGGGFFGPEGLSKVKSITDVIAGFGQIYAGIQANKIAKESLAFQKESYATNLGNQIQSYNTSLEDRARARYAQSNGTTAQADAYIDKNRLGG